MHLVCFNGDIATGTMEGTNIMSNTGKPSTAIARILRGLGLKQGHDFRVRGEYQGRGADRERIGTYVVVLTHEAERVVAANADGIEEASTRAGHSFRVSIHFTDNGRMWTWIANYGKRIRQTAPVTEAPEQKSGRLAVRDPERFRMPTFKLGKARPAFGQTAPVQPEPTRQQPSADPYAGLAQKRFGALNWACQTPGKVWFFQDGSANALGARYTLQLYTGRANVSGWYLFGPTLPLEGTRAGKTLTEAAEAAEGVIMDLVWIDDKIRDAARRWPKGTRVKGLDTSGRQRTGTVNGADWGVVTVPGDANYGRAWVDVAWDETPGGISRNRPFADELTRV